MKNFKKNARKYSRMIWEISLAEFKMRDQGTFFGFMWTLMYPLVYFLVLYNVFVKWMGSRIPDFPLYLIIGIVQWNFFASATTNAIGTIARYDNYVKSINFPKEILIMATVLSVCFSHLLEILMLILFFAIVKGHIGFMALGIAPLIILNIYLVIAVSFILATVGVYFLDITRIWSILTSVGLFLTPIFYSMDMLSPDKRNIILLNPMTHIITATRDMLIADKLPPAGGIIYVFLASTVLFVAGYMMFKSREGYFVEKI